MNLRPSQADPSSAPDGRPYRVLVTDDEPLNRQIAGDILRANGFDTAYASDGVEAVSRASNEPFDAILLDVMMPNMSGYDACRAIKAFPPTEAIPILLITALSDRDNRIEGIAAGANDFLSKPIDARELPLRVRNACRSHRLHAALADNLAHLQQLEKLRDDLTHMIVHDMRSPLLGISGHLELLHLDRNSFQPHQLEWLESAAGEAARLVEMVDSLLDVSRLENRRMPLRRSACDLSECAHAALRALGPRAHAVTVDIMARPGEVVFESDPSITTRILLNLMDNAVKAGARPLTLSKCPQSRGPHLRALVSDDGPGIPDDYRERIFDKFCQVEMRERGVHLSSGIGLSFCKLATESHGGSTGIASTSNRGTTIWFELPAFQSHESAASLALPASEGAAARLSPSKSEKPGGAAPRAIARRLVARRGWRVPGRRGRDRSGGRIRACVRRLPPAERIGTLFSDMSVRSCTHQLPPQFPTLGIHFPRIMTSSGCSRSRFICKICEPIRAPGIRPPGGIARTTCDLKSQH